jgi:hypothetical protein
MALSSTKGWKKIVDIILIIIGCVVMLFTLINTSKQWATSG